MYMLRWHNETGGDWMHDNEMYADLELCEITARMAFEDGYVLPTDLIQAWEVDDDGNEIDGDAAGSWTVDDFDITVPNFDD